MRWSLLLLLVAIPTLAFAEPKVAIAPLDGDDGKAADAVADAASLHAKVTRPTRVESAMRSLGVSAVSAKSAKKLRGKLDTDVVIYGTVEKSGGTKHLTLTFAGTSKSKPKLEVDFTSAKALRKELADKLEKRIDDAMGGGGGDDDQEDDARAKKEEEKKAREEEERKKREEEEARKEDEKRKKREEEARKDDEDKRKKKKRGDDDEDDRRAKRDKKRDDDEGDDRRDRKKKRVAADDEELRDEPSDDEDRPRKRKHKGQPHPLTQAALWLDAGGTVARRTFTYESKNPKPPPGVGTAAPAGTISAEVYPAAFSSPNSGAAGFGFSASYSQTFGLGIKVPTTTVTAPIQQGGYSLGARYRFSFGDSSLAVGLAFWRQYYMADRSKLQSPDLLDMPDVSYTAVAPGALARIAATPKISVFGSLDSPLMLQSGPIQKPTSYGAAKILALELAVGTQIELADHVALQIAGEFDQIGLSFTGQSGTLSVTRMVTKATDRSLGLAASIGIAY